MSVKLFGVGQAIAVKADWLYCELYWMGLDATVTGCEHAKTIQSRTTLGNFTNLATT
ncbi:hypothetical protein GNF10_21530 [Nostoc sp. UCD121]|uniref:hypothetical protein n=1 Tax=unclassified Nostoc TaxID=2593658 RepID=UPI001628E5CD|nr:MULTISPECIES: hypothetical protein [unclassified Nostoc]MBC1221337.1 hypothetical protein [Nostoc sp. UCD120]MBC1278476.1 hypothetical protein [Nostoc sp. UCD121]MBC1296147.1 hypothetical protein [Nostoc sp. UCD122]